ncbi:cocaine- and amphetamine-regulated transcript protein-like [Pseudophryne corroboree]|uniref:cocaine- and amphetamine-regulated transcript protein-like n=1 Tax=Pseudophryne corroboree TaxID=495146 RepID=UPI0030819661
MEKVRRCPPLAQLPPRHSAFLLLLCLSTLILPGKGEDPRLSLSQEDNSLAMTLGEMLQYNQDKGISLEKKASQVPRCDVGERCAMKHGPRIGKLCDCLRGASCNSFMLRCY